MFQASKKKSVAKTSIYEVLFMFSLVAFLIVAFTSNNVLDISFLRLCLILSKSILILVSWILALYAVANMSMSMYSIINLSRIIFSIALSVLFLGEKLTLTIIIGTIIIILGLILVNKISNTKDKKEATIKPILLLLFSCLLNSIVAIIDKEILRHISHNQLQFWFLLFLTILCALLIIIKKQKLNFKSIRKNYWIFIAGISLAIADKFLFIAIEIPTSKVSIMTLIKQTSAIEGIILGKILFKEKNIIKKLLCSGIIIIGIILVLI